MILYNCCIALEKKNMILGLIVRHYKIYKALNYIPLSDKKENNFSVYVGDNGAGKSSILEALNTFFNNGYWNKHKEGQANKAFIAPIFLIKKEEFNQINNLNIQDKNVLDELSTFFWNTEPNSNTAEINSFFTNKNNLSINQDDYYLLILGKTFNERNKIYFSSTFNNIITELIQDKHPNYSVDKILDFLKTYYSFVYIPVESRVSDVLKLETFEMQQLMNKDILKEIDLVLKTKIKSPITNRETSAVAYINTSLNKFMDGINDSVKNIDENYSFKIDGNFKKNLTTYDLRNKILEAYFAIRTLKKENKEIHELSSGEQRIALIDIASAFLNQAGENEGCLILAIDEPEASMHISKCFNQFKRLEKITTQENTQVLLTTHWYGSLPTIQKGNLHHLSIGEKPVIKTFDFLNYLEDRREFPDDIEMKSFFELVTTIISSVKNDNTNWLICEGSDDKLYLQHYLNEQIENLHILPVGGIGNVIKLYEYLYVPFKEKIEKKLLKNAKVFCLIASDTDQKTIKLPSQIDKHLFIKRLQLESDNTFSLKNLENTGLYSPTVFEDCLLPDIFKTALNKTIETEFSDEKKELYNNFTFNSTCLNTRLSGENTLLEPKHIDFLKRKEELYEEFKKNSFKYNLSINYTNTCNKENTPEVINKIITLYNNV